MKLKKILSILVSAIILLTIVFPPGQAVIADVIGENFQVFDSNGSTLTGSFPDLASAINDPSTTDGSIVKVAADLQLGSVYISKSITLTSVENATYSLTRLSGLSGNLIIVNPGKTLTLKDVKIDGDKSNAPPTSGSLIYINPGATLTMENGVTLRNNKSMNGGAVNNDGNFNMLGGTIYNCDSAWNGGGIFNTGIFAATGGELKNNSAGNCGGGLYNSNTANFTSSTISNNTSIQDGAGLYNGNSGVMSVSNSMLNQNIASHYGGGIFNNSSLSLVNSTIDGNSGACGGGVFSNSGTFILDNSTVSSNSSLINGGGVYNNNWSTFNINSGSIKINSAQYNGGGVYNNGTININGGSIDSNSVPCGNGGGICSAQGSITINGGTISNNTTSNYGGGIYNASPSGIAFNYGSITGNTAYWKGGGIYTDTPIVISDGNKINGNTSPVSRDFNCILVKDYATSTTYETAANGSISCIDGSHRPLNYSITTLPIHGNASGNWAYTPDTAYSGTDFFKIKVDNDLGISSILAINITVAELNHAPVVSDYSIITPYETLASGAVTANDPDGNTLTYSKISNAVHGLTDVNNDGTWTYMPNSTFSGNDSFKISVSDGFGGSAVSSINIEVGARPNTAPVASDCYINTAYNTPAYGILTATDAEHDSLTYSLIGHASHGTSAVNPDGSWSYTPYSNYSGNDIFSISITDGYGGTTIVAIHLTVANKPNNPPVVPNYSFTVNSSTYARGKIIASDADNDVITYQKASDPSHGTVMVTTYGEWTYTPSYSYYGNDSFTIEVDDGKGGRAISTVSGMVLNGPSASTPIIPIPVPCSPSAALSSTENSSFNSQISSNNYMVFKTPMSNISKIVMRSIMKKYIRNQEIFFARIIYRIAATAVYVNVRSRNGYLPPLYLERTLFILFLQSIQYCFGFFNNYST